MFHKVDAWCANVIAAPLLSPYGYSLEGACGKLVNQVSAWNLSKNSWTDLHYNFSICCFWTEELGYKEKSGYSILSTLICSLFHYGKTLWRPENFYFTDMLQIFSCLQHNYTDVQLYKKEPLSLSLKSNVYKVTWNLHKTFLKTDKNLQIFFLRYTLLGLGQQEGCFWLSTLCKTWVKWQIFVDVKLCYDTLWADLSLNTVTTRLCEHLVCQRHVMVMMLHVKHPNKALSKVTDKATQ